MPTLFELLPALEDSAPAVFDKYTRLGALNPVNPMASPATITLTGEAALAVVDAMPINVLYLFRFTPLAGVAALALQTTPYVGAVAHVRPMVVTQNDPLK